MRPTKVNDRWELILPDHRADFHEERPWWEAARLADMSAWLEPGQLIIDVGSEEGDFSALFAAGGLSVAVIDPSKPWMTQTLQTFAANDLPLPVAAFNGFAGSVTREGEAGPAKAFYSLREHPHIQSITLDDFCAKHDLAPDAVTMDVEGSELDVLVGAEKLLRAGVTFWISIHEDVDPHHPLPSDVHRVMRGYEYRDQFLAYDHEWHYRFWRE